MRAFTIPSCTRWKIFWRLPAPTGCLGSSAQGRGWQNKSCYPFFFHLAKEHNHIQPASFSGMSRESQAAYRSNLSPFDLSQTFPSWIGSFSFLLSPPLLTCTVPLTHAEGFLPLSVDKERAFAQKRALKRTLKSLLDSLNFKGRKEWNYWRRLKAF